MNIKLFVVDSSKSVENITKNNIKNNINIIIKNKLNIKLSREVKSKEEIKETLT